MKKDSKGYKTNNIFYSEIGEDATKYGEFISTYFAWIPLDKQKENAARMEDITKKNKSEH